MIIGTTNRMAAWLYESSVKSSAFSQGETGGMRSTGRDVSTEPSIISSY